METGLLEPADWSAQLISPGWSEDTSVDQPPTLLRRDFRADGEIASARLYVTAHGLFEAEINGVRGRAGRAGAGLEQLPTSVAVPHL